MSARSRRRRRMLQAGRSVVIVKRPALVCDHCEAESVQAVEGRRHIRCERPRRHDGNKFNGKAGTEKHVPRGTWRRAA